MSDANKPAFPSQHDDRSHILSHEEGLTKREYFAAMAMQGILAHPEHSKFTAAAIADDAIRQADALLAELEKPQ